MALAEEINMSAPSLEKVTAQVKTPVAARKSKVGTQSKTMRLVKKTTKKKVASPRKRTNGESEDENEYETYNGEVESDNQKLIQRKRLMP